MPIDDPGDLLARLPRAPAAAWVRRGAGLIGWGEVARVTLSAGEDRFTTGEKWLRDLFERAETDDRVGVPGSGPVAFGSFTFDPASDGSVLVVPRLILGRAASGQAWLTTITEGGASHPAVPGSLSAPAGLAALLADHPGLRAGTSEGATPGSRTPEGATPGSRTPEAATPGSRTSEGATPEGATPEGGTAEFTGDPRPPAGLRWHDGSLTAPEWAHAVARAVGRIAAGDLGKVVLARDVFATATEPVDPRVLLRRLAGRYPDCFTFACAGLVGATPELLVRRQGDEVSALILAGTAPRGANSAEDARLGAALLASAKNTEEHAYAVTSVRDTLAPLCSGLEIPAKPSLLTLPNLYHLGTPVRGRLATDRSALALAGALHPTAAVCGTPTETALELIRELENMERGRYAGPVGWVDAQGNGEFGIALRCAELDGQRVRLFAGCGIVAGSDPAAEVAETEVKFRPMRHALEG